MSIFISIAAYRDPELAPTIRDCLQRARYPDDIRFGICWQRSADDVRPAEFSDHRLRVLDVLWQDSQGACWARAEIMKLWDGEDFFLQLDSHHRFIEGWDAALLSQAERSGAAKPLLTSYAAPYDPAAAPTEAGEPMRMDFDYFTEDGIPLFRPSVISDWSALGRPLRARFVSAHFLFTLGRFVSEVPYDPDLYFHGEEIMLAIRAFTHGYTLFHPSQHILWHEYTRAHRTRHWDDHVHAQGVALEWHQRDAASRDKVRRFLRTPQTGRFGCGTERSFAAYEAYAGLSFARRTVQETTARGEEPPQSPTPSSSTATPREWSVRIVLDRDALPGEAFADPQFWYVGFHDASDAEVYREDASGEELRRLVQGNDSRFVIERHFTSERPPTTWTVWPTNSAGSWLSKLTVTLSRTNLSFDIFGHVDRVFRRVCKSE